VLKDLQEKNIVGSQLLWWIGRQITASRENRQPEEEVPHRDTGSGNGKQPSTNLYIPDN
jgi:hypothetical protein